MLKYYVEGAAALKSLRADTRGVVSFEYVIVVACIVAAVAAAFNAGNAASINDALTTAMNTILRSVGAAVRS